MRFVVRGLGSREHWAGIQFKTPVHSHQEVDMTRASWKPMAAVLALILIALLVRRLTRSVPRFSLPPARSLEAWGSLDAATAGRLQTILDEQVNLLGVPGLQAFVRTSDGKTWSGTSGTIDLARRTLMRRDHVLRVGSTTKTFTAVLILKLVEEGRLSLEDPLAKWFPDFPRAPAITVRQLLDHSTGIVDVLETEVLMKSIVPWTVWGPEELVSIAAKAEPQFAPGAEWGYSNTNYILLGMIAEKIAGDETARLLREQIFAPLQLRNTYFVPYETAPVTLVRGWDRDLSHFPGMLDVGEKDTSWATAAFTSGALASTADDLGVFYGALFAGELLSPASMSAMTSFIPADNPGFEQQNGYGLGLMRIELDGIQMIGHVGQFMGSTAIAMYAPEANHLIVVTCDLSYPDLVGVVAELQNAIT
jgi:D-alanyl-D-alanine carboxypeptidase